jgi:hypothetical protein
MLKDFFFLNLDKYENLKVSFPIGMFLIATALASCVAVFAMNYYKRTNFAICKQLMRHGATEEDKAKTLKELRLYDSRAVRAALSKSGQITHIVKRVGECATTYEEYVENMKKKGYKPEKIDFESARFYIAPDKTDYAKHIVYASNHPWWKPAAISAGIVAALVLTAIFLPDILSSINNSL